MVGLVSGLGACLFFYLLEWGKYFVLEVGAGLHVPAPAGERLVEAHFGLQWLKLPLPGQDFIDTSRLNIEALVAQIRGHDYRPWLLFLVPALGGLLSGLLVYTFAPEAEGHGTDAMIEAFHRRAGIIRARVPIVKSIASIITLATGGSAGREGPIAQIGAGYGSWLAQVLKMDVKDRRLLLLAGTAGGLGAIFRAPLGGAITAVEILYSEDFETEAIIPCIISSVVAYSLFTFVFGQEAIFDTPKFQFTNPLELLVYAVLGLVCAPLGILYIKVFYGARDHVFRKIRIPPHFKPALGGLGVGFIALFLPQVIGGGYGFIQQAIYGQAVLWIMILAIFGKMVTTALTIGSGGSGGVFGPSLFIGGMIGGVIGYLGNLLFPELVTQPGGYVLVGMASFFAGVASAPIGALLMVSEMTRGYGLLAPLMLVSVIAILLTRRWSIYEKQVKNKFASPAHAADMTVNVLEEMKVGDVFQPSRVEILPASMRFGELRRVLARSSHNHYPVVDREGRLTGILSLRDVRTILFEDAILDLVVVGDVAKDPVWVTTSETLYSALMKFIDSGFGTVPVVDVESGAILGLLDHEDVISAYHHEVDRRLTGDPDVFGRS
ncbi:MAG: chloride channel protein [Proteobacteria bacterium]|nr:chloride channel protein [Pseudomonadota bacterium]MBU1743120.1 chloride channel protein [Pseudomonadota bacterium]